MAQLTAAGVGELRYRRFTIKADGSAADITGFTITIYQRERGRPWNTGTNFNTTDDTSNFVVITAGSGLIELRPSATWWGGADGKAGDYEVMFNVASSPAYFAPDSDVHDISVTERPAR